MMKKALLLSVIIALSVYALFADPTDFNGYIKENGTASTKISFIYNKDVARIGFTGQALDTSSSDVPVEISEIKISPNPLTGSATAEVYAYWQIYSLNRIDCTISLSSEGFKEVGGSTTGCEWDVFSDANFVINKDKRSGVLYTKQSFKNDSGYKKLVITIKDYPFLKAGHYTLPLTLELVTL